MQGFWKDVVAICEYFNDYNDIYGVLMRLRCAAIHRKHIGRIQEETFKFAVCRLCNWSWFCMLTPLSSTPYAISKHPVRSRPLQAPNPFYPSEGTGTLYDALTRAGAARRFGPGFSPHLSPNYPI